MPGPSKVIVLDPDARAGRQVQLGFAREGVPVAAVPVTGVSAADLAGAGVVVVGGGLDQIRAAKQALADAKLDAAIVFTGRGIARPDAVAAGADEVLIGPAYLRDVVTVGRLMLDVPASHRTHLVGSLGELTGVLTLVRALAATGRSATLTLIRGLRRGEIRFWLGEVTSAQVGLIHGQAALHQLLLWTDARFDYQHEDIVRRHQIPLPPAELFADAERFLEGVRDSSGPLSPSMVLEQDAARVQSVGKQIPTEVHGVLRMFDGHRVLADILEDSPYRVFETLRVAQRAVDFGLLRPATTPPPKATWRAVLAIEEWLVGAETRDAVIERTTAQQTGPVPTQAITGKQRKKQRSRKKRRANTPVSLAPAGARAEIDWGALVPRVVGAEVGPLTSVVPVEATSGEIDLSKSNRGALREKLEALMNTAQREKIFPTELEPKVVLGPQTDSAAHAAQTEAVTIAETPTETVSMHDQIEVAATSPTTVKMVAVPVVTVTPREAAETPVVPLPAVKVSAAELAAAAIPDKIDLARETLKVSPPPPPDVTPAPEVHDTVRSMPAVAVPDVVGDEVSDGVIQETFEAKAPPPPPPVEEVPDDRPEATRGEIDSRATKTPAAFASAEPSILIADEEPAKQVAKAAATVSFSADEEDFFRAGDKDPHHHEAPHEHFADLDEGHQPLSFWDRLRGKKKK